MNLNSFTPKKVYVKERPSIYVIRRVAKGEQFSEENMRVIRPGNGLPPKHYNHVIGKCATRDIDAETPMTWDLIT